MQPNPIIYSMKCNVISSEGHINLTYLKLIISRDDKGGYLQPALDDTITNSWRFGQVCVG